MNSGKNPFRGAGKHQLGVLGIQAKALVERVAPELHEKILNHLNNAVRVEDMVYGPYDSTHSYQKDLYPAYVRRYGQPQLIKPAYAKRIIELKELKYPLGFTRWQDLQTIKGFHPDWLNDLIMSFSKLAMAERRNINKPVSVTGNSIGSEVAQALPPKTGKVLHFADREAKAPIQCKT
jgi:hypothetical protein